VVAQQRLQLLSPVGLHAVVLGGDTQDQPAPGPPGRLDGQMGGLLLIGPAQKEQKVLFILAEGVAVQAIPL
jgi:hypothetical protein